MVPARLANNTFAGEFFLLIGRYALKLTRLGRDNGPIHRLYSTPWHYGFEITCRQMLFAYLDSSPSSHAGLLLPAIVHALAEQNPVPIQWSGHR